MRRVIAWWSAGCPSAVTAKLALATYDNVEIVYCDTGSEHPDNRRFRSDCEEWYGRPITVLKSSKYPNTWALWLKRRYLNGPDGALCTAELKKKLRHEFQRPDDLHLWGYTSDRADARRAVRAVEQNPEEYAFPLIERGLYRSDTYRMIERAGIELPAMYQLGYKTNNCIPCVKGGMGYFNKIRVDFPYHFAYMALVERIIGHSCIHTEDEGMVFLDQLDPDRGNYAEEGGGDCSLLCAAAEAEYAVSIRSGVTDAKQALGGQQ